MKLKAKVGQRIIGRGLVQVKAGKSVVLSKYCTQSPNKDAKKAFRVFGKSSIGGLAKGRGSLPLAHWESQPASLRRHGVESRHQRQGTSFRRLSQPHPLELAKNRASAVSYLL